MCSGVVGSMKKEGKYLYAWFKSICDDQLGNQNWTKCLGKKKMEA